MVSENGSAPKNGVGKWRQFLVVLPVIGVLGTGVKFYLDDRNRIDDRMNIISGGVSENKAEIRKNAAKIEDIWNDYSNRFGRLGEWMHKEEDYDKEVRDRITAIALKMQERVDDTNGRMMELMARIISRMPMPPSSDYMAVPQHRRAP